MPRRLPNEPRASAPRRLTAGVLGLVAGVALAACGQSEPTAQPTGASGEPVPVAASFYPLEYALAQVGGDRVAVSTLTKPGAEPHDLELTPQDVAGLSTMSLVAYVRGFQPAVDRAVEQVAPEAGFDVSSAVHLDLTAEHEDHDGQGEDAGSEGGEVELDPHFWLDPTRFADAGTALGDRLAAIDPAHASEYHERAAAFAASMTALDAEFRTGLASCTQRTLVTSHAAFGYLAQRYDLTQVPIAGLSPEQEPSARQLADVAAVVKDSGATTIYSEVLVDPKFAQTIASTTGARVAVLDPIEGITDESAGSDYREVMRANLASLKSGQDCT